MGDYRTRIIPDHLYPKFRLLLDKFKNQNRQQQMDLSEIPILQDQESNPQEATDNESTFQTGNERITKAMESNIPHGTDATIKTMMQNTSPDYIEFPTDLREIKKTKSYKKRKGEKDSKKV